MTDGEALLAAVLASPEDDTPRLAFADWLDEQGNHDRAEFVRGQIRLAGLEPWDDGYAALDVRCRELERAHPEWLGWLAPHTKRRLHFYGWAPHPFERGFPARVTLKPEDFVAHHDRLFGQTPVREVSFDLHGQTMTGFPERAGITRLAAANFHFARERVHARELLRCLARRPPLAHFGLAGCRLEEDDAAAVFAAAAVGGVRSLTVMGTPLAPPAEAAFAAAEWPHLRALTRVAVPNLDWLRAPWVSRLRELRVEDTAEVLGPDDTRILADAVAGAGLTRLTLGYWSLDVPGGAALGAAVARSGLRCLALHQTRTTPAVALALLSPDALAGLRALFLSWADLNAAVTGRLVGSGLRACGLDHATSSAVAALADGPGLPELADLRLGLVWDRPDDPVPDRLCGVLDAGAWPRLVSLSLFDTRPSPGGAKSGGEGMGDRLAAALAACPASARLGELVLGFTVTATGAAALAGSPHLSGLRLLDVRVWPKDESADRALTERFGTRVSLDIVSREY